MEIDTAGNVHVTGSASINSNLGAADFATEKYNSNSIQQWAAYYKVTISAGSSRSSGYYKSNVLIQQSGSYQFIFSFNLKDSSGNMKKTNFSFNKVIEDTDKMTNHDHGFMRMELMSCSNHWNCKVG